MNFPFTKLLIFVAVVVATAIGSFLIFPLEEPTEQAVYNYETGQTEYKNVTNLLAVFITIGVAIGMAIWLLMPEEEVTPRLRTALQIIYDPNSSEYLSQAECEAPFKLEFDMLKRDSTIGMIRFFGLYNIHNKPVRFLAVAEENYRTTETRPKFNCPIFSTIYEVGTPDEIWRQVKFSERGTIAQRMKSYQRDLQGLDEGTRKYVIEQAEKSAKDESDEDD